MPVEYSENFENQDVTTSVSAQTEVASDTADLRPFYEYEFEIYSPEVSQPVIELPPPPPEWEQGLLPVDRPVHNGNDTGFVTIIVILMLGMCFSFKVIQRIWGTLIKRLWTTRVREDYDHITSVERRTVALLLCVAVFFIALLVSAALSVWRPAMFVLDFSTTMSVALLTTAYFVFQYAAYWVIGTTFTTDDGRRLWIEGFTASMSLLGITLLLPGIAVLFYPDVTAPALFAAVILYVFARIMFICKGFKIFYTNFGSIVYFILYLCSLEIVPLAIFYYYACKYCSA